MVSVARRNLFAEKTRLLISVGGVAFSVLLILVLLSLYQGWQTLITRYIGSVEADLWVVQEGASDMFHAVSIVPKRAEEDLKRIEGVQEVHRLLLRQFSFKLGDKEVLLHLIGYDTVSKRGGPPRVISGKDTPGAGEIIIDEVFAENNALRVGNELTLAGQTLKIVGISEGGNFIFSQLAFVPVGDAEKILEMENFTNFFLVSLEEGQESEEVIERVDQSVLGVKALSGEDFAENNREFLDETFLPILWVLVLIGFGVGVAVIGLTIYTTTIEKSHEYGILKAVGASNLYLYRIIFEQSLISALFGFGLGVILAYGINYLAAAFVPEFVTLIRPQDVVSIFGAAILMSLFASYIPIKKIAGIDPAAVFKA